MTWSARDARRDVARAKALRDLGDVRCPNCGAEGVVQLINVSVSWGETAFIPGEIECSAQCWRHDPEGYLRAVRAQR